MHTLETLDNSLSFISAPVPESESANLLILVKAGSRYETGRTNGLAHFAEHLVFKGTKSYPDSMALARAVESVGGRQNAFTNQEAIGFWISTASENLLEVLPVLVDLVFNPLLRHEDLGMEKGVIIEEINRYEDIPQHKVESLIERVLWSNNSLGRDILGTKEVVRSLKREDFANYLETFFSPRNMVAGVAGNFSEGLAKEFKTTLGQRPSFEVPPLVAVEDQQTGPQLAVFQKETEQTHFCLNFKGYPYRHPDRRALSLVAAILGGGMSSRLFCEIREKRGLAYAISASSYCFQDVGALQVYGGVVTDKARGAVEITLEEIRKLVPTVDEAELEDNKRYLKGGLALSLETNSSLNSFLCSQQLLIGEIKTYDQVCAEIDAVTLKDIKRVAGDVFVDSKLNFALVGPFDDEEPFRKILTV